MSDHDHPDHIDVPPDVHPDDIDLEKIPRELWQQALAPLHRSQRGWIVFKMRDPRLKEIAGNLAFELDTAEIARAGARQQARGRAVGLRPTTLARALVLNGAAQVLRERASTAC